MSDITILSEVCNEKNGYVEKLEIREGGIKL